MDFDPAKNAANIAKHGMGFAGAEAIFEGDYLTVEDRSVDYGEARWHAIGALHGRLVVLTFTTRGEEDDEVIRAISLRPATRHEALVYAENFPSH